MDLYKHQRKFFAFASTFGRYKWTFTFTCSEYNEYKACEDDVIRRCGAAQQRRVNTVYGESAVLKSSVEYIQDNGKC